MKYFTALLFTILCALFAYCGYKKDKDYLSPACFFAIYFYLMRIPRMIIAYENAFTKNIIYDTTIIRYSLITFVYYITVSTIMLNGRGTTSVNLESSEYNNTNNSHLLKAGIVCFVIGAFSRAYIIVRVGGINYIWNNIIHRTTMTSSMGYLDNLSTFMTFGIALVEFCYLDGKGKKLRVLYYSMVAIASVLLLAFGQRSPLIKLFITIFFVKYYRSERKDMLRTLIKPRNLALILVLAVLIVALPMFRSADFVFNRENLFTGIRNASRRLPSIVDSVSTYDEDLFTFDYFSNHKKWLGRSYSDLLYAWIPRKFMQNKPPVDDGVYLRSLMMGADVVPSVPLSQLPTNSSVPFTNNGIAYANFGIFGSVLYGIIYALIINRQYRKMLRSNFLAEEVVIYQLLCTRLTFSVKGIVEMLMLLLIYHLVNTMLKIRIVVRTRR